MFMSRTRPITPTSLALFEQCPSKFIFTREKFSGKLGSASLFSIKGTLMHDLIESYSVTGEMPTLRMVDALLEQQQLQQKWLIDVEQWPGKWTLHKLIGKVERSKLLQSAKQKILAYQTHLDVKNLREEALSGLARVASEDNPYGTELDYRHEGLELEGRADLTFGEGQIATVVDFKSGQTKCKEGNLKREYYLQLGAYGLMLQRFTTAKTIFLKAEGADTTSKDVAFKFDNDHRTTIIKLCKEIISTFPRDKIVQPGSIAKLGEHCRYCPGKPVCSVFTTTVKQELGYADTSEMGSVLAKDIQLESTQSGWVNLTYKAVTGKEGRVVNIPPTMLQGLSAGDTTYLHNMKWGSKFSDGAVYNFYVADPSKPQESSFDFSWHKPD